MSNAKQNILQRLRANSAGQSAPEIERPVEQYDWSRAERIERFCQRLQSVRAEVHRVSQAEWTSKLRDIAAQKKLGNLLYAPKGPLGETITQAWQDQEGVPELISREGPIETFKAELFNGIDAAITSTRCGIAEVGALVLWSSPEEPRSFSLVPPVHFAVIEADKLYSTFAETIEQENWAEGMPTNAILISGPSKSADIEQTLAYGVHGPMELVVLLIE